jgi:hypothetical protein
VNVGGGPLPVKELVVLLVRRDHALSVVLADDENRRPLAFLDQVMNLDLQVPE